VTHADHLADDVLSELVDEQRSPAEVSPARAHLDTCAVCQARLAEMETLVGLLRALPSVEPPRDFRLGPRLVADPPNVVRLRRWYAVTRVAAGALAAAFVFLSVGTLYVDSRPVSTPASLASKAQPAVQGAPAPVAGDAATNAAPAPPTSAPRPAAAPAAASAAGQPAGAPPAAPALAPQPPQPAAPAAGAAVRSNQAAPSPTSTEPGDQIAAATTVRPLPTQVPTPTLVAQLPTPFASAVPSTPLADPAAPLRTAAALVGILAALGILVALLIRHRLLAASPSHLE
jgi:hypothetical protein